MNRKRKQPDPGMLKRLHTLSMLPTGSVVISTFEEGVDPIKYVYQRTGKYNGNLGTIGGQGLQLRRELQRSDRKSQKQLALRERLAMATSEWKALGTEEREAWKARAGGLKMTGYNLFASEFIKGARDVGIVRFGMGPPANSLGANGDLYIELPGMAIYGPKTAGEWKGQTDIVTSEELSSALSGYEQKILTEAGRGAHTYRFGYGDASPAVAATIPAGSRLLDAGIEVTEAFDGTGAALSLGPSGLPGNFIAEAEIDPGQQAIYEYAVNWLANADTDILLTITPGTGATAGGGFVRLTF